MQAPPLPVLSSEAMRRYGCDRPDTRFGLELVDCAPVFAGSGFKVFADALAKGGTIKAVVVPDGSQLSRKDLDDLTEFVAIYGAKGLAWIRINENGWQPPIVKFLSTTRSSASRRPGSCPGTSSCWSRTSRASSTMRSPTCGYGSAPSSA
jgi:aspartyl-tRNA synthetase